MEIEGETLGWWMSQSEETRSVAFSSSAEHIDGVLRGFQNFYRPDTPIWSKGPGFDIALLGVAYEKIGLAVPWHYRKPRDVRTIIDVVERLTVKPQEAVNVSKIAEASLLSSQKGTPIYLDLK